MLFVEGIPQGWVGEVVLNLDHIFLHSNDLVSYFFAPLVERTRVLMSVPYAFAFLFPEPDVVMAAIDLLLWAGLGLAARNIVMELFPSAPGAAFLAGLFAITQAYDTSALMNAYIALHFSALFFVWAIVLLLAWVRTGSPWRLIASGLLIMASLFTYGAAAIVVLLGPVLVLIVESFARSSFSAGLRRSMIAAVIWGMPAGLYAGLILLELLDPASYLRTAGLSFHSSADQSSAALTLFDMNFDFPSWIRTVGTFGAPPRLFAAWLVWSQAATLAVIATPVAMLVSRNGAADSPRSRTLVLSAVLIAAIVACAATGSLIQGRHEYLRTHVISRLFAAILLGLAVDGLLRSRRLLRLAGLSLCFLLLLFGGWTVADRGSYLSSIWSRHREELRSLVAPAASLKKGSLLVLYVPPGSGYTATVASWHARAWIELIRGEMVPDSAFFLWSSDRASSCRAVGDGLDCAGEQPLRHIPYARLVLLEYEQRTCRFALVAQAWPAEIASEAPARVGLYDPSANQTGGHSGSRWISKVLSGVGQLTPASSCR